MIKIDKLDRKIITELDMNARIPTSKLAKVVRSSREVVQYRIKTLTKKGVIAGTQTFFNPAKIGYSLYRILIRLNTLDKEILNLFQNYFINNDYVMWFAKIGGKWDYIIEFFAKNANQFDNILNKSIDQFKKYIQIYDVFPILKINCYKRKYIYDNKRDISFSILGEIKKEKLDKIDLKIIHELKVNAQKTNTEIAQKLNLTRNTIKYRVEKLKEKGIISGFKLFYHPSTLNYQSFKLLISMKTLDQNDERKFFLYTKGNPNIIFAHKNLSKWNYELEIECENFKQLQEVINDLRINFKGLILDYEIFPVLYDYKIDLFPMSSILFKKIK